MQDILIFLKDQQKIYQIQMQKNVIFIFLQYLKISLYQLKGVSAF